MNRYLDGAWIELVQRLAVGIEPIDALTRGPASGVQVMVDAPFALAGRGRRPRGGADPLDAGRPMERTPGGRFLLRYGPRLPATLTEIGIRIADPERRYVPRRFRVPLVSAEDAADADVLARATGAVGVLRAYRPWLYPGAACLPWRSATGARLVITRAGAPARWAHVVARVLVSTTPRTFREVGVAHADDRGEALLVIDADDGVLGARPIGPHPTALPRFDVELSVVAPAAPVPAGGPPADPLWDREPVLLPTPAGQSPTVIDGRTPPAVVPAPVTRTVTLTVGRLSGSIPVALP